MNPASEQLASKEIDIFLDVYRISNDQGERLDFKNHAYLYDVYQDFSPKQATLKAAQIGFCLAPETKVLTKELRWITLDDLKVGQALVATDENHGGNYHGRKMLVGIVEEKREIIEDAFEIFFEDGRKLLATENHRFLSKVRGAVHTQWRSVGKTKVGDVIRSVVDRFWDEGNYDDGWIGGVIDGEGSLRKKSGAELTIIQRPGFVLDRVRSYMEWNDYHFREILRHKSSTSQNPVGEITLSRTDEIMRLVGITRPVRFKDRTDWWDGTCLPNTTNPWVKIVNIIPLGKRRMIDIQTSTKTFIAEGFVSHNSTMANIKALWVAKNRGMDIIYSLPSAADIKDFVGGKTNRLISNNPIFQQWTQDKDSVEQKRVGANVIYFKGTWTERAAIATPADLYISDETDRSKQEIVTQYKSRLQHSKYGWEWYFSNPSAPGAGVDIYWQQSDQMHWFITCDNCSHEWYITMDNIMGNPPYYGCLKCQSELDRTKGRWVAKYAEGRTFRGYWIPLLIVPSKSASYVIEKQKEFTEEQFCNFVLGQPYVGTGNVLLPDKFFQNLRPEENPQDCRPIIGVDTGAEINYVIGNKYGIYYYAKCKDYDVLESLLRRYPNAIMVIDQGGDIIGPRKLREKYPNRVYLCFFRQDQKNDKLIDWNDDDGTVRADRNKMLQLMVDEFSEKRIPIYGTQADWWEYWLEWKGMYRTSEENSLGVNVYHWNKPASGRCDYPFASVYWRIGMDRFLEESVTFIGGAKDFAHPGIEVSPEGRAFFTPRR